MTLEKLIEETQRVWKTFPSKPLDRTGSLFKQRITLDIQLLGEDDFCLGGYLNRVFLLDNTTCQIHVIYSLDSNEEFRHDILICSSCPLIKLDHIVLAPGGKQLAMYGKEGVHLMDLHAYLCKSNSELSEPEKVNQMTCRSQTIYQTGQPDHHGVLQVRWHPHDERCLIVLTNDENLRYFNTYVRDSSAKMKVIPVKGGKKPKTASPIKTDVALNEKVVDFDFCSQHVLSNSQSSSCPEQKLLSILVLLGCGDVIHISGENVISDLHELLNDWSNKLTISNDSTLKVSHSVKIKRATLKICPSTEDNYGSDFLSILCLRGLPNAVVLGTSSGQIHHALMLLDSNNCDDMSLSYSEDHHYTLCVVDRVQLDTPDQEDCTDGLERNIFLRRSLYSPNSYFIIHYFGVHAAVLPWLNKIRHSYIKSDSDFDIKCLEPKTVVDYLLCTSPLDQSSFCLPSIGFCETKKGPRSKLYLLLISGEKIEAPIHAESSYVVGSLPFYKKLRDNVSLSENKFQNSSFDDTNNFYTSVKQVLQYDHNIPIFSNVSNDIITDPNCLQSVLDIISAIQNGHLKQMKEARSLYNERIRLIKGHISFQKEECGSLTECFEHMCTSQENLLEKCKKIHAISETVQKRLSCLRLVKGPLSRQELVAKDDLERISSSIKANIKCRLERLKANVSELENKTKNDTTVHNDQHFEGDMSLDLTNNNVTSDTKVNPLPQDNVKLIRSLLEEEAKRLRYLVVNVKKLIEQTATIE